MTKRTFHDLPKEFPFSGTREEFDKLLKSIESLKDKLENSNSPREIIFESWFIFDYYFRMMILKGFEIEDFENEKLDLMYELLPQSFDSCLSVFEKFLKNQREIYDKKMHPNTYFKNHENTIGFKGSFIAYMINEKADLFNNFYNEYWKYLERTDVEYLEQYNNWDYSKYNVYKITGKTWLTKSVEIDSDWFKTVKKLNKCRNKAAHLYDDKFIYAEFGINGDNKIQMLKDEIIELIKKTLKFDI